ncbi:hypothetical protein A3N51_15500 [Enterobacter kobei]|jgi:hypothetical protein|uniref:hypothetical protein n=1 Tax=Enterobacter TaxID=547 RepID=UPI00069FA4B4|nr:MULTISPECIES: hypothetical protein [Enterobacter]EKU2872929.1 hypothetical protein [Enterobacter cloacae]KZQ08377.1 hypothetical protein A3N51_15500 [Enterobacter kobei]MBX9028320.1 hypothetical protein [Enterobacter ludwigii]MDV0327718.1 hypothetical protein [Enterobacter hormaechei]HCR1911258.1 hypothetical protein [Enterobacter kobei]
MIGLYTAGPAGMVIEIAIKKAVEAFSKKSIDDDQTPQQLNEEALKAELQSTVLQAQAKVQQELSIARRILVADEVEIEEYYDGSGSAGIGLKSSPDNVSFGINGEGKKITKRVIKFKGFNGQIDQILQQIDDESLKSLSAESK